VRQQPCMPRYFFDLTNGDSVTDEVGEEFDLVEAARRHAMAVARELSRNRLPRSLVGRHISVVDERGVVVFKILLIAGMRLAAPYNTKKTARRLTASVRSHCPQSARAVAGLRRSPRC
jgi:hypothetical protein